MSRISIEVTSEQHQQLKVATSLAGKTLNAYVLEKILPHTQDEKAALPKLEEFLKPRIEQAKCGKFSEKSTKQIAKEAYEIYKQN